MANGSIPGIGRKVLTLAAASFVNASTLIAATVISGLQFTETQGQPTLDGIIGVLLTLFFFATPAMAAFTVPLGLAAAFILNRQGWMKIWVIVPAGMLIGLGLCPILIVLPDLFIVAQLNAPIREIACAIGGAGSGLMIWLGMRVAPED